MRIPAAFFLFPALLVSVAHAQTPPPPASSITASSILSSALDHLRQSLSAVRLEKWKAPGAVRQETNSNMGSIARDLDGTLPGLLATADAAPGVVSKNLPVFRNVDALYDVLLRIVETAELAAPEADTNTLHGALAALDDARRTLGDAMESSAAAQEQQLGSLREKLRAQADAAPPSTTVVEDGSKPAAKSTHRHRSAAKKPPEPQPQP